MQPKVRDRLTKKEVLTIPNMMSMFRLLLIPIIGVAYLKHQNVAVTVLLLFLSGLSDMADGWVARKFHMVSDFGKILDPIADKLTQLALIFFLVWRRPRMWCLVIMMAIREIIMFVTGLRAFYRTGDVGGAEWHGKLTTCAIYSTMVLHIVWVQIPDPVSDICVTLCLGMLILSLILYTIRNVNMKKEEAVQ